AWRGYVTALHDNSNDRMVVSEAARIPAETRSAVLEDTGMLSLLAAAHAKEKRHDEAVKLFAQARARYRAAQSAPPAGLDLQVGWALLAAPGHDADLKKLLLETSMRTDLSPSQRAAFDEMRSLFAVRSAEVALKSQGPDRAAAILLEAGQE